MVWTLCRSFFLVTYTLKSLGMNYHVVGTLLSNGVSERREKLRCILEVAHTEAEAACYQLVTEVKGLWGLRVRCTTLHTFL